MSQKRIEEIDILKALGIICMVAGHSDAPFAHFIYLFHMAIFFIASGFFYKDTSSDNLAAVIQAIKKKIKQLWFPFFIWNAIFVLLHNIFIDINIYADSSQILDYVPGTYIAATSRYTITDIIERLIRGILLSSGERMFSACWFLRVLFMVSVCYLTGDFLAKKVFKKHILLIQFIASFLLLALGFYCSTHNISAHGIAQTASFYCLYFLGHVLSLFKGKYADWKWKQFLPVFVVSFGILVILSNAGFIALDENSYENPLFLLAASFTGWMFCYSASFFIKQIGILKYLMSMIGKRTLTIVVLHFLSLKIVEIFVVVYYGLPDYYIAAFPNLYGNKGVWWLLYTIVGTTVPVLTNILYYNLKNKVKEKLSWENR